MNYIAETETVVIETMKFLTREILAAGNIPEYWNVLFEKSIVFFIEMEVRVMPDYICEAEKIVREDYGITAQVIKSFSGYEDLNFLIKCLK